MESVSLPEVLQRHVSGAVVLREEDATHDVGWFAAMLAERADARGLVVTHRPERWAAILPYLAPGAATRTTILGAIPPDSGGRDVLLWVDADVAGEILYAPRWLWAPDDEGRWVFWPSDESAEATTAAHAASAFAATVWVLPQRPGGPCVRAADTTFDAADPSTLAFWPSDPCWSWSPLVRGDDDDDCFVGRAFDLHRCPPWQRTEAQEHALRTRATESKRGRTRSLPKAQ